MGKRKARRPARAAYAPRLIVMAKSPCAGRAKRRLAASVGAISATRFYRSCLAHTLMRLARDPRWQTLLAVSPDSEVSAPFWPRGIERQPQGRGDLGARMQRLFRSAAARACDHRRQRHPGHQGKRHRMRLSLARQCGRGVRLCDRRRLLARRLAPHPAPARAVRRRALVWAARPCRHAWQPQGIARRLRGNAERRRY